VTPDSQGCKCRLAKEGDGKGFDVLHAPARWATLRGQHGMRSVGCDCACQQAGNTMGNGWDTPMRDQGDKKLQLAPPAHSIFDAAVCRRAMS
jgi:hypothetical protein